MPLRKTWILFSLCFALLNSILTKCLNSYRKKSGIVSTVATLPVQSVVENCYFYCQSWHGQEVFHTLFFSQLTALDHAEIIYKTKTRIVHEKTLQTSNADLPLVSSLAVAAGIHDVDKDFVIFWLVVGAREEYGVRVDENSSAESLPWGDFDDKLWCSKTSRGI